MKAFFQGQFDYFCTIYAVLNALQICCGVRPREAAKILARTLRQISQSEPHWLACLDNSTDFHWLPLWMLSSVSRQFPLQVHRPFSLSGKTESWCLPQDQPENFSKLPINLREDRITVPPSPEAVAASLHNWLDNAPFRCVLLRFHRHLPFKGEPLVSHWSTGIQTQEDELLLLDASKEENALHSLPLNNFCTSKEGLNQTRLIRIEPDSIYLLENVGQRF